MAETERYGGDGSLPRCSVKPLHHRPVPWNAEQQNQESVQRNADADQEDARAGETSVPDSVRDVIFSPGQSLDPDVQRTMESEMGDSFSDVQVHTGPKAAQACDDINARAFTVGNNIAFNHGEYDPGSPEGQHVLAHELAHVRQQTGGAVSMLPQDDLELEIDPDPELEKEAEETAQRVMQGGELGIQRMSETDVHVQRFNLLDRLTGSEEESKTENLGWMADADSEALETGTEGDVERRLEVVESNVQFLFNELLGGGAEGAMGSAATDETIKAGVTAGSAEGGKRAVEMIPKNMDEAEELLSETLDASEELVQSGMEVAKMLNEGEVQELMQIAMELGIDGAFAMGDILMSVGIELAPNVIGAMAVVYVGYKIGIDGDTFKRLKKEKENIAAAIRDMRSGDSTGEEGGSVTDVGGSRGLSESTDGGS